jgi:hypothetical protein
MEYQDVVASIVGMIGLCGISASSLMYKTSPQPPFEVFESIQEYAEHKRFFVDFSRKKCLDKYERTLNSLSSGKLERMSRFSELLLGPKHVGKTCLLKLFKSFVTQKYSPQTIVPIYISYDTCDRTTLDLIVQELKPVFPTLFTELYDFTKENGL